jgi:hypothetical protein
MALTWEAKAANETKRYRWKPPVQEGDGLLSFSSSASGATIDSEDDEEDEIVYYVSGGTNGTTAAITLSALTNEGETLTETVYLPIAITTAGETVETIIAFALKPVVGLSGTATTAEKADALEHLNDWLAEQSITGADVGAALPLLITDTVYAPRGWAGGIKNNLRVRVAEQYGRQVAPATMIAANRGLQAIKFSRLDHEQPVYY